MVRGCPQRRPFRAFAWLWLAVAGAPPAAAQPAGAPGPAPVAAKRGPAPAAKGPAGRTTPRGGPSKGAARAGPDEAARRVIAGALPADGADRGPDSPELRALRAADQELFPTAPPAAGAPWPSDWSFPAPVDPARPRVRADGLPRRAPRDRAPEATATASDVAWVRSLALPALPVRWDARVITYLVFFRDDPRGRQLVQNGYRKSGRYAELARAALRAEGVPEDLLWVAMFESNFDPRARSPAGAAGLWQFMPEGGRVYGLRVERWVDERLDPALASEAAAKYLADLYRRFGSWELALAGYNMGHGGLSAAVRKYNANDFWELCRYEAGVPWETALYVPKIVAMAIAARNPAAFGLDRVAPDPPARYDALRARGNVSLEGLARASGVALASLEGLNPHLRARRTPPDPPGAPGPLDYPLRAPEGRGPAVAAALDLAAGREPPLARRTVRFGETSESIAAEHGVARARLLALNALAPGEGLRAGDVVLVPAERRGGRPAADDDRPVVAVPAHPRALPGRERVFYRVAAGDALGAVAAAFGVGADDVGSWNRIDPSARLHEGMVLQLFVSPGRDLGRLAALREADARPLLADGDEFLARSEAQRGRRRIQVTVGRGDTWEALARRYACSVGLLERINRRGRREPLKPGDVLVVYTARKGNEPPPDARRASSPLGPASAPRPDDLPAPPEPGPARGAGGSP